MAAPIDTSAFKEALIVLTSTGVVIPLIRRFRVSPVLGFMIVGILVGPYALGALATPFPWLSSVVITEPESIAVIAELGVALLMFMIGLELSFERLSMMRRLVFGLGGLQLSLCALAIGSVAYFILQDRFAAIAVGLALAMSSTAVIIQVLSEAKRLAKPVGRTTFAVLLLQDLAAVPILLVISVLGAHEGEGGVFGTLGSAFVQAAAAIVAMIVLGRIVLRPLFRMVAGANSPESFMAASLLVILGAGMATAAAGMSMAMGALIAGLLLAETEYRRQIEVIIEPFKGILLGVFLISVGMSINLPLLAAQPLLFVGLAVALVAGKAAIVTALARGFGLPPSVALQTGLLLAPGSEFTFVIIGLAHTVGLVSAEVMAIVLALAAGTMASIPFIERFGRWTGQKITQGEPTPQIAVLPDVALEDPARVIVCGFGRVGQTVATMLETHKTPYLAIDADAGEVARHRKAGRPVAFGDARRIEFLRLCDIAHAKALVVTIDSPAAAGEIVEAARAERPDLLIVARARDARDAARLYRMGATDAVPETTEAALVLCEQLLVDLGVPMGYVIASVHDRRAEQRLEIQKMAPDANVRRTRVARVRWSSSDPE
jgi:monovalent cation:H+ antiporter-2, CPA2 family